MKWRFAFVIAAAALAACSKPAQPARSATGMATWDEVRNIAEAFVLQGESAALRAHTDCSGIPQKALSQLDIALTNWTGVPNNLQLAGTQVVTLNEYQAIQQEDRKELPEDMRRQPSRIVWNIDPEKVIVFTFTNKAANDTTMKVRWSAGAYRTNGLWYFAASYAK